jgi:LysR family hydrogen peroxide-inducible transcriptional activator
MQIKNLENELGLVLIDRSSKPIRLTDAGKVVEAQAKIALSEFYKVKGVVSDMKNDVAGVLRLGVIPTIAPYLLHKFIPEFVRRYPEVSFEVYEMITPELIRSLYEDHIDVAIMAGGSPEDIEEKVIFKDRFYAYVSDTHPLSEREHIKIDDIQGESLLLLPEGHCLRDQVLDLCGMKNKYKGGFCFESGSLLTLMRLVDSTSSMTIIPEMSLDSIPQENQHRIRKLGNGGYSRPITLSVTWSFVKQALVEAMHSTIVDVMGENCDN